MNKEALTPLSLAAKLGVVEVVWQVAVEKFFGNFYFILFVLRQVAILYGLTVTLLY